jgi:hypothetical protein
MKMWLLQDLHGVTQGGPRVPNVAMLQKSESGDEYEVTVKRVNGRALLLASLIRTGEQL